MLTVQARLAQWRSLYDALCAAEQQLRHAQDGCCAAASVTALRSEVRRLQDESEQALNAVDSGLAVVRHDCGATA